VWEAQCGKGRMDLAVRLVPEQSCWVALPPRLLHDLAQAHDIPAPLLVEARVLGNASGAPLGPGAGDRGQGSTSLTGGLSPTQPAQEPMPACTWAGEGP